MYRTDAFGYTAHFLVEERTETYKRYGEGVLQPKNEPDAKTALRRRVLPGLERRGA